MTLDIWDKHGGPAKYGFNPIYTYPGKGNKRISSLGGVIDKNGDAYYTSYPPFAFIAAYYFTKSIGGPDVSSLRSFGLVIHLFCTLLIYLIIVELRDKKDDRISIAGLFAASMYLFSAGSLWMHGIMYFSDMLVQLFVIWFAFLFIKLVKQSYSKEWMILTAIGCVTFLGVYTEWLALFLAFFSGIFLLIAFFIWKRKVFLKGFLVIGASATLSLSASVAQYSSIAGFDTLVEVSQAKYKHRSGNFESVEYGQNYNWENPESLKLLETNVNRNWPMAINMFPIMFILLVPVLIWRKSRKKIKKVKWKLVIIGLLAISIMTHYFLFFNFNAIHNFSNFKTGLFMILVSGIIALIIEEALNWKFNIALAGILLFFLITRSLRDIHRFQHMYNPATYAYERDLSADYLRNNHDPDKLAFSNLFITPGYMYRAQNNVFQANDTAVVRHFMGYLELPEADYYIHDGNHLIAVESYLFENDSLKLTDRIELKPE